MRSAVVVQGAELAQLIRERKDAILARWEGEVRSHGIARNLPRPALIDSMPVLVDRLARAAELGSAVDVTSAAMEHAQQRLELGYELGQLLAEYEAFRGALIDELQAGGGQITLASWSVLNRVIAATVTDVTQRFSRARERKLRALERISAGTFQAGNLDDMLQRVIDVLAEVVPEVDEVTVLLREGNSLHVRATRGLHEEIARAFSVAVGEGFAGTVAATREPLLLHDAANDPLPKSDVIRALGLRALYGVPLFDQDEVIGVAHMGSKVAYDFQQEDLILFRSIANRAGTIIAARRVLERERAIDELRDRFIGVLAHDLAQPINAVLGSARLMLRRGKLDEADQTSVERIARSTERMARLVRDVLDFARARLAGGVPVQLASTDLCECVRHAVEEARLANPTRGITLREELGARVRCDADRVTQCVSNLLGNAQKHGDQRKPVEVSVGERGDDALIVVHNDGPPIPPELLPHIFDPFRRGAGDGTAPTGLGLGLYIAKAIAVAHGGSIEVRSDATSGTSFVVGLPKHGPRAMPE